MPPLPPDKATTARTIVLFDDACPFCVRTVRFVQRRDRRSRFRFAALQSTEGLDLLARHGLSTERIDSAVLIETGAGRSTAALRICRRLSGAWSLLFGLIAMPRQLRDTADDFIARRSGEPAKSCR